MFWRSERHGILFSPSPLLSRELSDPLPSFRLQLLARRSRVFYRATVPIYARSRPYPVSLLLVIFPLSPASCPRPSRTSHLSQQREFRDSRIISRTPSPTSTSNLISPSSDHSFAELTYASTGIFALTVRDPF